MKKILGSALLMGLTTTAFALPDSVHCLISPEDKGNSPVAALEATRSSDEFNHDIVSVQLLDKYGDVLKSYDQARGKSQGRGSGWFHHPSVPADYKITADYRSPDHCTEYEAETRTEGGFFGIGAREILEGYKCLTGSPQITVKEVYPDSAAEETRWKPEFDEETGERLYLRQHEIADYIEEITIADGSLKGDFGLGFMTDFINCQEI